MDCRETFWILGAPAMHQGNVVFEGVGTLGTQGIFCYCDGALVMVASREDPVPGLPDGVVAEFGPMGPAVIHEGRVLITAQVWEVNSFFSGLYEWVPPNVIPIVDRWTTLPQGQPPEDTIFHVFDLGLEEAGATFLFGGLENTSAIYRFEDGNFETLVTHDTQIPVDPPVPFFSFGDVVAEGEAYTFYGFGSGEGGVTRSTKDGLALVADVNTQVPGGEPGEVFTGLNNSDPVIGNGTVIFMAGTSGGEGGFYRQKNGELQELATTRTLNPLTGTPFNDFDNKKSADGDNYAFVAGTDNETLFYGDAEDRFYAIATEGEDLEGQYLQFLIISKHAVSGNQLAFSTFRENDEAIFIATIGDPPQEIPTLHYAGRLTLVLLLGLFGLLSLRRL